MSHDPLCSTIETGFDSRCQCDLIAKVRADERGLSDEAIFNDGQRAMLAKCIHKVSLYLHEEVCSDTCRGYCAALDDVIAALKDLQEQP